MRRSRTTTKKERTNKKTGLFRRGDGYISGARPTTDRPWVGDKNSSSSTEVGGGVVKRIRGGKADNCLAEVLVATFNQGFSKRGERSKTPESAAGKDS